MKRQDFKKIIREIVDKVLAENAPAKPVEKPGPAVAPGEPSTDKPKKPRRDLNPEDPSTLPNVNPKATVKKAMNEEEILKKIVARFKSKK